MNYAETLEYLYNKLPMFSRIGSAAFKKDLTNTLLICEHLGNPHAKFKSIHVAGTNGKGSVSHMLSAIFQTAGYKTGLYTSPHLNDFRERIKINGMMVPEEFVMKFTEKVIPLIEKIQPSFFEITVAMAFEYFAEQKVDIAIVETGLGGRLDSTNIITPELSVITNISYDHMNILGNSLEDIAKEKAGIIKQEVAVIIGEKRKETETIFSATATAKNAAIFFSDDLFNVEKTELDTQYLRIFIKNFVEEKTTDLLLDLPGLYQAKNIKTVLTAVEVLKQMGWNINDNAIYNAVQNVKKLTGLHGRWEVIQLRPTVVLEVAHNEDGIKQMLDHVSRLKFNQLHIIFGVVKDKEIGKVLSLLPTTAHYYFTHAHIPRAMEGNQLQEQAKAFGLEGAFFEDVNLALTNALQQASETDLVIICGSIFLVAEVKISER